MRDSNITTFEGTIAGDNIFETDYNNQDSTVFTKPQSIQINNMKKYIRQVVNDNFLYKFANYSCGQLLSMTLMFKPPYLGRK